MKNAKKSLLIGIFSGILLCAFVFLLMVLLKVISFRSDSAVVNKVTEIETLIDDYFVGDYDEAQAADDVAEQLIDSTGDRWSYYISAEDYESHTENTENAYVGIGITILKQESGDVEIVSVDEGGPAEACGIQPGDSLISIDGQSVDSLAAADIRSLVRGTEGTTLQVVWERDGIEYQAEVTRKSITVQVAALTMVNEHVAYIKIKNFNTNCFDQTKACVDEALANGADCFVFDVRNNPGGYSSELVKVLDMLLPEGPLFTTRDYAGNEHTDYSDEAFLDAPMAVLINADSYSAAEFFAAALQEYDAAEIIGEKTCGKGYFQYTYRLSDGSAVALSSGTYYTPDGQSLAGVGVTPDIAVSLSDEDSALLSYGKLDFADDSQLQSAISQLESGK